MISFGSETWKQICDTEIYGKLLSDLILEYGKSAFQDTMIITSKITHQTISSILVDFHSYTSNQ